MFILIYFLCGLGLSEHTVRKKNDVGNDEYMFPSFPLV